MKKRSTTGMAALVALGVSVGMTAEVGAKAHNEEAKVTKATKGKKLQADKLKQNPDAKLDRQRQMDRKRIKMDGPPRP